MGIFNKIFGSSEDKTETPQDLDYINSLLVHSKDEPLGVSEKNLIYIGYSELGGYYYLQTYIVGKLKVKTKTGAKLHIKGKDYAFDLNADMDEFESDKADLLNGYVTKIDFEIEKETVEKISRSTIEELVLALKKEQVTFLPFEKKLKNN